MLSDCILCVQISVRGDFYPLSPFSLSTPNVFDVHEAAALARCRVSYQGLLGRIEQDIDDPDAPRTRTEDALLKGALEEMLGGSHARHVGRDFLALAACAGRGAYEAGIQLRLVSTAAHCQCAHVLITIWPDPGRGRRHLNSALFSGAI